MTTLLCTFLAQAGDYTYLVFTNTAGTTTAMTVDGLTMTVNGTSLQVTNTTGSVNITLTDLEAMQFSSTDTITALDHVLDADKPLQVFTPMGVSLGSFESLIEAARRLDKGTYIITNGTNAQTIILQ